MIYQAERFHPALSVKDEYAKLVYTYAFRVYRDTLRNAAERRKRFSPRTAQFAKN